MTFKEYEKTAVETFQVDFPNGHRQYIVFAYEKPPEWMAEEVRTGNYVYGTEKVDKEYVETPWKVVTIAAYMRGKHKGLPKWGPEPKDRKPMHDIEECFHWLEKGLTSWLYNACIIKVHYTDPENWEPVPDRRFEI